MAIDGRARAWKGDNRHKKVAEILLATIIVVTVHRPRKSSLQPVDFLKLVPLLPVEEHMLTRRGMKKSR